MNTQQQTITAAAMRRATDTARLTNFEEEFLMECEIGSDMLEDNAIVIAKTAGRKFNVDKKLKDTKKDIFKDFGYEWCGHQKYTEFVVHLKDASNNTKKGRKLAVFMTVDDAMEAAELYGANSIVLQDNGFSLRWGCRIAKNPQEKYEGQHPVKYTGMGVWVKKHINAEKIINGGIGYSVDGQNRFAFKISDGLKKHIKTAAKCGENPIAGKYPNWMSYFKGEENFVKEFIAAPIVVATLEKINVADIASGEDAAGTEFNDAECYGCLSNMVEEKLQVVKCRQCSKMCCETCRLQMDGCGQCRSGDKYSGYNRVRLFNRVRSSRVVGTMRIYRQEFVRDEYNE